ncbi:glycosyltransferase family 2 protein [Paracoccus shandongensis]|uniref:glycosyltransferase family 2 protein n=1 Tax=Paracoccus shandongensis TaxID=2816048 RepID=UPI001A8EE6DF|nr:glycosyltransferase family 2 protein [Paracoccus shandongensis]
MPISTVVTSMKDEAPYVIEWVAYHRALGFDRIVVLANDCTDGTHEMLTRLHEMEAISYYENVVPVGAKPHSRALKIANLAPEVKTADFVMVLDADEFLVVKSPPHILDVLLDMMEDKAAGMMVIPWRLFGSSHNMEFEDRPVIERFTQSMDAATLPKVGVKTLFRQADNVRLAIHFPKFIKKAGEPVTRSDAAWIDAGGQPLTQPGLTWNGGRQKIHRDHAEVAHFMIKSLDEYLLKIFRGDGLMNSNRHGIDYWRNGDHNQVSDLVVADNVSGFAEERDRLFADPVLSGLHRKAVAARFEKLAGILANPDVQTLRTILKKSTKGGLQPEDIQTSRDLVRQMSPAVPTEKLIDGDIPHSTLVSITDAGLADASAISWRMFKKARHHSTMFWPEKKFGARPITNLADGLKRAQKRGAAFGLGVRWFHNYARVKPQKDWLLDDEILVVLTRDDENIIAGFPAHVAATKAKYAEKPQGKGRPPLRQILDGSESPAEVEELIARGDLVDPRQRLKSYLGAHPEAIVLNLDHLDAVREELNTLEQTGPSGAAAANLLRDVLEVESKNDAEVRTKPKERPARKSPASKREEVSEASASVEPWSSMASTCSKTPIKLYWFRRNAGAGINFGDDLGPLVVKQLTGREIEWAAAADCDLASVGSILSQVSRDAARNARKSSILVWGSGLITNDPSPLHRSLDLLAIRGELTRDTLGLPDLPLGDPGIFAADVVPAGAREYAWGIVPHYSQRRSKEIRDLAKAHDCLLIDPTNDPVKVLRDISSCEAILSSSLHGLIVADSYGIPCCWLNVPSHKSHEFKFADYCSGVRRWNFDEVSLERASEMLAGNRLPEAFSISDAIKDKLSKSLTGAL